MNITVSSQYEYDYEYEYQIKMHKIKALNTKSKE